MHIYGDASSPFVQRVLMAGRIKGHELDLRPPPGGSLQSEEFVAISPMGRAPLLEEDGWRLCESDAIISYLDDVLAGPKLVPGDARERAYARQITSLAQCELEGMRSLMIVKVFQMSNEQAVADAGYAQLERGMDAIETVLHPAHRWAAGDAASIADLILVPVFTLMTLVDPYTDTEQLITRRPKIFAYYKRAKRDPIAGRTVSEMTQGYEASSERMKQQLAASAE